MPWSIYVANVRLAPVNNDIYSSFSSGEKKSRRTTIVRGGNPRSSALSSFVRLLCISFRGGNWVSGLPEHHPVEKDFKLLERRVTRTTLLDTVPRNGRENLRSKSAISGCFELRTDLSIPKTNMLHWFMSALITIPSIRKLPVQALAIALFAEVVAGTFVRVV